MKDITSPGNIALSPDGTMLSFSHYQRGRLVSLWKPESGEVSTVRFDQDQTLGTMHFSSDSKELVIRSIETVRGDTDLVCYPSFHYFEAKTGAFIKKLIVPTTSTIAVSEGIRFIACRGTGNEYPTLAVLNVASGKKVNQKLGHHYLPTNAAFSSDASLLITRDSSKEIGNHIKVWDCATGNLLHKLTHKDWNHPASGASTAFSVSPDNRTLAVQGMYHLGLQFFDLTTGKEIGKDIPPLRKKMIWPVRSAIVFLVDNKHVAVISGEQKQSHNLEIWNVEELKKVSTLAGTAEKIGDVELVISANGRYIARNNSYGSISFWQIPKLQPKEDIKSP